MTSAATSIPRLFEFLEIVGKSIRRLFTQKISARGQVKVVFELGPRLEAVIRDVLVKQPDSEDVQTFWRSATYDLIKNAEEKFHALSALDVSDVTIGTEAIMQRGDEVPDLLAKVAVQYVLAPLSKGTPPGELLTSPLSRALQDVIESASRENATGSWLDRLQELPVDLTSEPEG